jgi:hypothetical protein
VGGAIGGYSIVGASRADNAPLLALYLDRSAHVTGNYTNAVVKFDRVIRPDGTVQILRRVSPPNNPNVFAYIPRSWPGVAAVGKERILGADGRLVAEREVLIPESQIMQAGIPNTGGPVIATLAFERDVMPDGRRIVTASIQQPDPGVELAVIDRDPVMRQVLALQGNPVALARSQ